MKRKVMIPGIARVTAESEEEFWRDPLPIMSLKNDHRWKKTMRWKRYLEMIKTPPEPYWRTLLKRAIEDPIFPWFMALILAAWVLFLGWCVAWFVGRFF